MQFDCTVTRITLSKKMAEAYFKEISALFPSSLLEVLSETLQLKQQACAAVYIRQDLKEWKITDWIEQHKAKLHITESLREQQLHKSLKTKAQLEAKLQKLQSSIDMLSTNQQRPDITKTNFQGKDTRHVLYEHEQARAKEAEEEAKRRLAEQKLRRKRLKEHLMAMDMKAAEEESAQQEALRKEQEEKERQYRQRLEEMKKKSRLRQQELSKSFDNLKERSKSEKPKPLYMKMQEKFDTSVVIPELENRKAELQRKRARFRPLDTAEISQHSEAISRLLREREYRNRKSGSSSVTKLQSKINDELKGLLRLELTVSHDEEGPKEKRRRLRDRQHKYATLAQELHWPAVSPSKQLELRENINKLKTIPKPLSRTPIDTSISRTPALTHFKPMPKPLPEVNETRPYYKDYIMRSQEPLEDLHSKLAKTMVNDIKVKLSKLQRSFC